VLGYETATRVARRALEEGRKVAEIVREEGLLTDAKLNELLRLDAMTGPSRPLTAAARPQKALSSPQKDLEAAGRGS
jgi:aspartate ammonia-lyase